METMTMGFIGTTVRASLGWFRNLGFGVTIMGHIGFRVEDFTGMRALGVLTMSAVTV